MVCCCRGKGGLAPARRKMLLARSRVTRLWRLSPPKDRPSTFDHDRIPTCHHLRIKMSSSAFADVFHGIGGRGGPAVGPYTRHGIKHIDDVEQARPGMNLVALESDWIALSVEPFVVLINQHQLFISHV